MEKQIHVNSYYRKDGTYVRDYYRNIDTDIQDEYSDPFENSDFDYEENPDPHFPDGDIPRKKLPDPEGNDGGDAGGDLDKWEIIWKIILLIIQALGIAYAITEALNNANAEQASKLKPQFDNALNNIKNVQKQSESLSKKYLDRIASTKDKQEYSNLLKGYREQSDITKKIRNKIARIEYASKNNNYTAVIEDLNSFKTDFDTVMQKNRQTRPLKKIEPIKLYNSAPLPSPYMSKYMPQNSYNPIIAKKAIDNIGMPYYKLIKNAVNAEEFWKASSHDFKQSKNYINQNGTLVYSVKDLPTEELQNIVSKKLQEQFEKSDTLGVIFKPHSQISQLIPESPDLKQVFYNNVDKIINGKMINSSAYFGEISDLKLSIGHADIIYIHIDENWNLNLIVLDTYDFNKNDPDWKIKIARRIEESSIIREYYTLILVRIPFYLWLKWILEFKFDNLMYTM